MFDFVFKDNNEDVVSELTIGPAFQGNLTKILRARKQQQPSQSFDESPVQEKEKAKVSSPPRHSSTVSTTSFKDNPLMKELNDWKIEHNRYVSVFCFERKKNIFYLKKNAEKSKNEKNFSNLKFYELLMTTIC